MKLRKNHFAVHNFADFFTLAKARSSQRNQSTKYVNAIHHFWSMNTQSRVTSLEVVEIVEIC